MYHTCRNEYTIAGLDVFLLLVMTGPEKMGPGAAGGAVPYLAAFRVRKAAKSIPREPVPLFSTVLLP